MSSSTMLTVQSLYNFFVVLLLHLHVATGMTSSSTFSVKRVEELSEFEIVSRFICLIPFMTENHSNNVF